MICGIGIDLVAVERIARATERSSFIARILTKEEMRDQMTTEYIAGRWAAKEAVKKCCPWVNSWHDVVIVSDPDPVVEVRGLHPSEAVWVSITHERTHAAAVAIRERR